MKKLIQTSLLAFYFTSHAQSQIDSINTSNHKLNLNQLKEATNTYLVYFQDSINKPKRDMEIWERTITKEQLNDKEVYKFLWNRSFSNSSSVSYTILADRNSFKPLSEETRIQFMKNDSLIMRKSCFIYEGNTIYTSPDSTKHNGGPFKLENLNNSFNFEMDMETFSMLNFKKGKSFALNFYHPGSKTPPRYYSYVVVRKEKLLFNNSAYKCWVLKVIYDGHGFAEFWIDKKTNTTLKMREEFDGKLRFKELTI